MVKEKECNLCGKIFQPISKAQKYCGSKKQKIGCSYKNYIETQKKYYKKHYKECREKYRLYYQNNRNRILLNNKQNVKRKLYSLNYNKTNPKHFYSLYRVGAKRRKKEWNITFEQFMQFWQKSCHYCGDKIKTIGLDRVDTKQGYFLKNIVSCCSLCNKMKWTQTQEEFFNQCKKIIKKNNL